MYTLVRQTKVTAPCCLALSVPTVKPSSLSSNETCSQGNGGLSVAVGTDMRHATTVRVSYRNRSVKHVVNGSRSL